MGRRTCALDDAEIAPDREQEYNDIQPWKFKDLPGVFGADPNQAKSYQVKTKTQLEELLADSNFSTAPCLQLVELYMPKEDAPIALKKTAEAAARRNAEG